NCFLGASGTLLIVTTLTEQNINVDALGIAMNSIPIAVIAVVVGIVYNLLFDMKMKKKYAKKAEDKK
ncbi:MAG: DUF969 family protein, partial [Oscillospiraceae bacterium]